MPKGIAASAIRVVLGIEAVVVAHAKEIAPAVVSVVLGVATIIAAHVEGNAAAAKTIGVGSIRDGSRWQTEGAAHLLIVGA